MMVVLLQAQYHRGATWGNQLSFFFGHVESKVENFG